MAAHFSAFAGNHIPALLLRPALNLRAIVALKMDLGTAQSVCPQRGGLGGIAGLDQKSLIFFGFLYRRRGRKTQESLCP
jgi:hypothetical protein